MPKKKRISVAQAVPGDRPLAARSSAASLSEAAPCFFPSWWQGTQYSQEELDAIKESVLAALKVHGWEGANGIDFLPASIARLIPYNERYSEFIDINSCQQTMAGTTSAVLGRSPLIEKLLGPVFNPLKAINESRERTRQLPFGHFLSQSGNAIKGLLAVEWLFNSGRSSMRMRKLGETAPRVITIVTEYLCGEGFHIKPPSLTSHDHWIMLIQRLKFDWIRDNRTRIFTEVTKSWRRSHTPFEQFAFFFFFLDFFAQPTGMLTNSQKPVMVAALSGDIDATVLLCDLGFFIPPDDYWLLLGITDSKSNRWDANDPSTRLNEMKILLAYYRDHFRTPKQSQTEAKSPEEGVDMGAKKLLSRDPNNPWNIA